MQVLNFDAPTLKVERTHVVEGVVLCAEAYTTKDKIPGVVLHLDNCPYPLRVLMGSVKGVTQPQHLINCTVSLTGVLRDYEGKSYFNPKDLRVTRYSGISDLVRGGGLYAGSLS